MRKYWIAILALAGTIAGIILNWDNDKYLLFVVLPFLIFILYGVYRERNM